MVHSGTHSHLSDCAIGQHDCASVRALRRATEDTGDMSHSASESLVSDARPVDASPRLGLRPW